MTIFQETPDRAMADEFRKFLYQFRCEKTQQYTHTSIGNPKVSLHVPKERLSEFHDGYRRAMIKKIPLHLTEKPTDPSPMRADLDFRFSMGQGQGQGQGSNAEKVQRMYKKEHIERILGEYFDILSSYVEAPETAWKAYIMEKQCPTDAHGKIKDGIHIVWPYLPVTHNFQHLVRKKMLDNAPQIFTGLPLCNTYENIIDQAIIDKNNWQMYGSQKPDSDAYGVTFIYTYDRSTKKLVECPPPKAHEELEFVELFSMRFKEDANVRILPNKVSEIDEYVRLVLPTMDERKKTKLHSQIFGKSANLTKNMINEEELALARQLVSECLNPRRAENYEDWIKVGWALRNIDYRLLDSFIEFSRCSSKYIEGECQSLWSRMRNDTLGMGTLRWWARHDNPIKYTEILDGNVTTLIDRCIGSDGAHFDVAKVVHALYKDRYRFNCKDVWYVFREDKHRWVRTREGLQLRIVLSNEVCMKFMERSMYWNTQGMHQHEGRDIMEDKSKKVNTIALRLKNAGFKDSVMKECKGLFTDEHFEELLDAHPHLIGFENGVYDLRLHEFRDGLPDDFISFTTGRHFVPLDPTSEEVQEIDRFMASVFTNEGVRKYMKDMLAGIMDGGIRQEKFYIFTGSGCHAKDTEIMMADGTLKLVQDIQVGDQLMGDDSTPRNVLELFKGLDDMIKIIPTKGEAFTVNRNHVLSLMFTNLTSIIKRSDTKSERWRVSWYELSNDSFVPPKKRSKMFKTRKEADAFKENNIPTIAIKKGDVIDIKVCDLMQWGKWWNEKGNLTLYRPSSIEFEDKPVALDPYFLGYWLGDGTSEGSEFTTAEKEVVEYVESILPPEHKLSVYATKGKAATYGISYCGKRVGRYTCQNEIRSALKQYNLIGNKHIPADFLYNSRNVRMEMLAGLMDSDGTYQKHTNQYSITQKNKALSKEIERLARSLGFAAYMRQTRKKCTQTGVVGTYYIMNIVGDGIEDVPVKCPRKVSRKRVQIKNVLLNSFKMEEVGQGDYFGFELDGNHRYLMGNGMVTHNSNGKSKILELVQRAFGDYFCILPIALLTQKRAASNSAQSELERTKGRRFAVMQEPGENERMNIGLMKELSGGDRIMCRGLFKEPIEFKPQFKMILTCNELPEVPSDDGGTWRRIRVIEFTSKFTETPDPRNPKEFAVDLELSDKFDRWADVFVSMMIEHHKTMDAKNIMEPMEVRIATEGYKKNNDVIGQYISEKIVRDEDSTERVALNKTYTDFKVWAFQAMPKGKKIPDRNQFRAYMEKLFGVYPSDSKGWKGIRFIADAKADEEGECDAD